MDIKSVNQNKESVDLIQYFDLQFSSIQQEIQRLYQLRKEKDSELTKKIECLETEFTAIKLDSAALKQKIINNTADILELDRYKKIVDDLNNNISSISTKLELIEKLMDKKQKNTLTIAIAILSPILTAFIGLVFYFLFYVPASP